MAQRISFLVIAFGLAACVAAGKRSEDTKMPLDVNLKIEKTGLLFQENPGCLLTLTNSGKDTIQILNPAVNRSMPILRVVEIHTGVENLFQKKPEPWIRERHQALPPGEEIQRGFLLLDEVDSLMPGEYEVSIIYEYKKGANRSESEPVKVKVLPSNPKNLNLINNGPGGVAATLFGIWVNLSTDPPQIVEGRFEALAGGGVKGVYPVTKGNLRNRPYLSAPPNLAASNGHWIAWVEENFLKFVHFEENLGPSAINKFELPVLEIEVVPPMHSDPVTDTRERPAGAALLWMGDPDGTRSGLQVISLSANKATSGGTVNLPGPRPRWLMSHESSKNQPLVTYVQSTGEKIVLSAVPWPEKDRPAVSPRKLSEWKGRFVAAGASINEKDNINGSLLVWMTEKDGSEKLEVVDWTIDYRGEFREAKRHKVDWNPTSKLEDGMVRVSAKGLPAALLRDSDGKWFVFDGQATKPVPGSAGLTKLPIELVFMGEEPILLLAEGGLGFRMIKLDGSPLPGKPW